MGLGGTQTISLKQARESAARYRAMVAEGQDPVALRQRQRLHSARNDSSFRAIAFEAFQAKKAELKGDGKAGRWMSPLTTHILPKLGKTLVEHLDQNVLKDVLAPIWHSKAEVARKALNRTGIVLRFAAAKGLEVDLQATAKARELLGRTRHEPAHIPAMPWQDVPAFYASISDLTVTHLALRFLILTGMRSAAVRHCRLDQLDQDIWTVPGELMKGRIGASADFRVPLSSEAQEVVKAARAHARGGFLFASPSGKPISDMTLSMLMKRRGLEARPHGFRASLRVWIAEETDTPFEIAETVLAHTVGSKVVRSYQRSDYLEQRRRLMDRWGGYVVSRV
jgi:integrase